MRKKFSQRKRELRQFLCLASAFWENKARRSRKPRESWQSYRDDQGPDFIWADPYTSQQTCLPGYW